MASYVPVQLAFDSIEPDGCDADKAPVIFLHGVTASRVYWDDIPQTVANTLKRKVYAIDARNHGDSEWSDVFNFDSNVDDLLHFMDRIGAPKAILVGHSMGGITAIKTALRAPERVEKLVIEDISGKKDSLPQEKLNPVVYFLNLALTAIQKIPEGEEEEKAKTFILDFLFKFLPPEIKNHTNKEQMMKRIQLIRTADGKYSFKGNTQVVMRALKDAETIMTEPTGLYEGPAYFLYGKLSPLNVPSDEAFIKNLFPNSKLFGFENATHGIHSDCPKEFTETVLNFLQE
ncbi:hypothetical protein NPIL_145931 [Nephila pilipes]|uniref:sn-1-specific diacylglycerol lipase ABHD11 n=1 Tax=Nephila pilipes TaxID=299642 RepID=A0A8X6TER4_NEPPI|nr:hypothetical protein NPIL_145931 [Nephila pilipes]